MSQVAIESIHKSRGLAGHVASTVTDNKYSKICNNISGSNILFRLLEISEKTGWWTHGLVQLDLLEQTGDGVVT